MPAISVSVNTTKLATVCADGLDVISVSASGTMISKESAHLEVAGSKVPEHGDASHLYWVSDQSLRHGEVVTVTFLEHASCCHAGKTIDELFPEELFPSQGEFKPINDVIKNIRAQPRVREKIRFRLQTSSKRIFIGETRLDEHGFGFGVLWNSFHPDRARVSLHSYTLESLETHGPMSYHIEEHIRFGDFVRFELLA